jgi:hypothetical protein
MTISDYERRILESIDDYGWFCVGVGGDKAPAFSYSVGFPRSIKCPEFIVFGQSHKLMHSMLGGIFRQIRDGVTEPSEGQRWSDLIEGYDCVSRWVHPSQIERGYFNSAIWYARHMGQDRDSVRAYQLFWPGVGDKVFPWENGCAQAVRDLQPLLYLPRETGLA